MKLGARLRGFSDEAIVEGGQDAERRAQDELNREQQLRIAMTSGWPELPRSDLEPAHLGLLVHKPSGEFYAVSRGVQFGEKHDSAAAFYGRWVRYDMSDVDEWLELIKIEGGPVFRK